MGEVGFQFGSRAIPGDWLLGMIERIITLSIRITGLICAHTSAKPKFSWTDSIYLNSFNFPHGCFTLSRAWAVDLRVRRSILGAYSFQNKCKPSIKEIKTKVNVGSSTWCRWRFEGWREFYNFGNLIIKLKNTKEKMKFYFRMGLNG